MPVSLQSLLAPFLCVAVACGGSDTSPISDTTDTHQRPDAPVSSVSDSSVSDTTHAATDTTATDTLGPDTTPTVFAPVPLDAEPGFDDLFTIDRVAPIELRITQSEWNAMLAHMQDYSAIDSAMRTGRYFRAAFVYRTADGDELLEEVGFRTRGNTTRELPEDPPGVFHRAHFKLKFDATFDLTPGTPAYIARDARRYRGLKELNLRHNRDRDPSQIRELFAWETFRQAGLVVPRVTPAALTLTIGDTSHPFGLYLALEGIDKPFLRRRLGPADNDGDLYKCLWLNEGPATLEPITNPRALGIKNWETNYRPAYDLQTNNDTPTHAALLGLIHALDTLDTPALATWLYTRFDVEHFLRFLALNVLIGMPDDYWAMGNNYYLYFAPDRALFIPWDYDHGLGGGWGGDPHWSHAEIATSDVLTWKNLNAAFGDRNTRHPLVDELLKVPHIRARYLDLLREFTAGDGLFALQRWTTLFDAQAPLYAPHLDNVADEGELMEDTGLERAYFATRLTSVRAQLDALSAP